ncbi:hypothetical protein BDZ89DRAFT_1128469 [Hymenopellis radicata]|nr:hypothetical protein BDZ89DRAFT_1128469 [Hymenopellis radicata]
MSSFTFGASKSTPANLSDAPPPPSSKRNSHHRRRSSVSTRRESAEMMGMDLPQSISEDNITLGEKDSIRRRALWALEGKPDASYSKVEIPELMTPDSDSMSFDFPSKPSFPPGTGANPGLSSLMSNKRDSFKLLGASASSKDQLHTLVEEDEDEEETPLSIIEPSIPSATKPLNSKPRPATLSLRPLSLTPDALSNPYGLPTPPSASQSRQGLRSLSLCSDRTSQTPSPPTVAASRKPVLNLQIATDGSLVKPASVDLSSDPKPARRRSITYKRSSSSLSGAGLPTPEMTPTFDSRRSLSSVATDDDDLASHFRSFRRVQLVFCADDEMLRLVADLKAERDELKRDVEGWRERVADMDKQLVTFAKRIENERREAWVARTKCGMVEVERAGLTKEVENLSNQLADVRDENRVLQGDVDRLSREKAALEDEVARLKANNDAMVTPTVPTWEPFARKRGVGIGSSLDSATSSVTDVDESPMEFGFSLKSVAEEPEEGGYFSDEDSGLAGYEDEDEDDLDLTNSPMSDDDFGSDDGFPRSVVSLRDVSQQEVATGLVTPVRTPPSHQARASLSKTWTFPRGPHASNVATSDSSNEVDRFFGCLDDKEDSPVLSTDVEDPYSFERSKGLFASGFKYDADTDMPAWLLGAAALEEEEEEKGLILLLKRKRKMRSMAVRPQRWKLKMTTTIFLEKLGHQDNLYATDRRSCRFGGASFCGDSCFDVEEEEDDDDVTRTPFNFGQSFTQTATPPASAPRMSASPSGIPRAIPLRSSSDSPTYNYQTPPNKRTAHSFIPQPVSPRPKQTTTFIRQPVRKPLAAAHNNAPVIKSASDKSSNVDGKMNALRRFSDDLSMDAGDGSARAESAVMMSVDLGNREPAGESPRPAASWSPRLFSSFTNYIGLSLSPKTNDAPLVQPFSSLVHERRFVTKEQQLEKLKVRLATEGSAIVPFAGDVCKKCQDDDAVFL